MLGALTPNNRLVTVRQVGPASHSYKVTAAEAGASDSSASCTSAGSVAMLVLGIIFLILAIVIVVTKVWWDKRRAQLSPSPEGSTGTVGTNSTAAASSHQCVYVHCMCVWCSLAPQHGVLMYCVCHSNILCLCVADVPCTIAAALHCTALVQDMTSSRTVSTVLPWTTQLPLWLSR